MTTSASFSDILHTAKLRHVTDGFTSPLMEGMLIIFSPLKIRWLRQGMNPLTSVIKSSPLRLVHQRCKVIRMMCEISLAIFNRKL
jgi:hypothetical protein